jgi:hypothetical protein
MELNSVIMECVRLVAAFHSWSKLGCPGHFALENAKLRQVAALQGFAHPLDSQKL